MAFKCKIGFHSWNGCKCSECAKTRDEQHDWSKDCEKCSKCGKTRDNQHDYLKDCEKCSKCSKVLTNQHTWSKDCEKCSKCGKIIENKHDWSGCKCGKCGKTRDEQHNWKGCKCSKCNAINEQQHQWNGCMCSICGKIRNEEHQWEDCTCKICKKEHNLNQCYCTICNTTLHDVKNNICQRCDRVLFNDIVSYIKFKHIVFDENAIADIFLNYGETGRENLMSEMEEYNKGVGVSDQQVKYKENRLSYYLNSVNKQTEADLKKRFGV